MSRKDQSTAFYGFALYLASSVAFVIYLLWIILPSSYLHHLGIYYYPSKFFSLMKLNPVGIGA